MSAAVRCKYNQVSLPLLVRTLCTYHFSSPGFDIAFLPWGLGRKNFKRAENEFLPQGKMFDEKSHIVNIFLWKMRWERGRKKKNKKTTEVVLALRATEGLIRAVICCF